MPAAKPMSPGGLQHPQACSISPSWKMCHKAIAVPYRAAKEVLGSPVVVIHHCAGRNKPQVLEMQSCQCKIWPPFLPAFTHRQSPE